MNNKPNPNSFVLAFGLDPDQFEPYYTIPHVDVTFGIFHTTTYELTQRVDGRKCPRCGETRRVYVKDRYVTEREISTAQFQSARLVINVTRFECIECGKSFTVPLKGIDPYGKITEMTKHAILVDCCTLKSFRQIANEHHVSPSLPIKVFDEWFGYVPPVSPGRVLCVDEVCMRTDDRKNTYAVVLSDFESREICDIFPNRQLPYLKPSFEAMREEERRKVKVFVTDMYDGYARIRRLFFPWAVHCVDLFHVVKLMTTAVGKIRVHEMNQMGASAEKSFMKQNWRAFLCAEQKLGGKVYRSSKFNVEESYFDMVIRCCKESPVLWEAWSILQELLTYNDYPTFTEAAAFVDRIVGRLESTQSPLLRTVARTYRRWRNEIANGMARNQTLGKRVSNSVAEGNNNKLKSLKKLSKALPTSAASAKGRCSSSHTCRPWGRRYSRIGGANAAIGKARLAIQMHGASNRALSPCKFNRKWELYFQKPPENPFLFNRADQTSLSFRLPIGIGLVGSMLCAIGRGEFGVDGWAIEELILV